ncbi:ATP-binding protein [Algoriphagus sp. CAU 1675]|uniref:AlbA family DNA-binding domain-containing protein n=1 Tax=Algoriphagus sp. CAU 1675 TaxID=3032597 RepID=UPI0023D9913E|nr:ATP-binding protein [Algoriphagus sp. CAU 1675]MDF2157752.1 ATP-binding protein [Algoriphagus sp. CAU 1675]
MNSAKNEEDFIRKILQSKEGISLDFKQKITSKQKIARTIASLANTKGGMLIIGVSDKKRITGIDPAEERYMIESANENYCNPHAELKFDEIKWIDPYPSPNEAEEKYILLVFIFKKTPGPVKALDRNGTPQTYIRKGDKTILIV